MQAVAAEEAAVEAGSSLVEHEMQRLARLIALDVRTTPRDLSIELTPEEHAEAAVLQGGAAAGTLVLSIGTKLDVNHWGLDNWSALVRKIASLPEIERLVFIGRARRVCRFRNPAPELAEGIVQFLWPARATPERRDSGPCEPVRRPRQWSDASRSGRQRADRGHFLVTQSPRLVVSVECPQARALHEDRLRGMRKAAL